VEVAIFDVAGRRVRTLIQGTREPGEYRTTWDSRDDNGRSVTTGVYFVRMNTGTTQQVHRVVRVR
jgi:flagellar hook assembly protein FlgD